MMEEERQRETARERGNKRRTQANIYITYEQGKKKKKNYTKRAQAHIHKKHHYYYIV